MVFKKFSRGLAAVALTLGMSVSAMADTTTPWSRVITQAEIVPGTNTFELLVAQPDVTSFTVDASGGGATGGSFLNAGRSGLNSTWLVGGLTPMPVGPGLTTAGLTVSTLGGSPGPFTWTFNVFGSPILPVDGVTITGSFNAVSPVAEPATYAMMLAGVGFVGFGLSNNRDKKSAGIWKRLLAMIGLGAIRPSLA